MKIETIRRTVYGALITGVFVMVLPLKFLAYHDYLIVFMYIGGGADGICSGIRRQGSH